MEEIKTLDDKYLVLKKEDLDTYFSQYTRGIFTAKEEQDFIDKIPFKKVLTDVDIIRRHDGKKDNRYIVLNLNDEIDVRYLIEQLKKRITVGYYETDSKVKDIAIDLVNAILTAKEQPK